MNVDIIWLFIISLFMGLVFLLFIRLRRIIRGSSSGMFMVASGATDAFYDRDKEKAIEMIVEKNANKKMDEQSSGDPLEKSLKDDLK
jgi:hypothetical protein